MELPPLSGAPGAKPVVRFLIDKLASSERRRQLYVAWTTAELAELETMIASMLGITDASAVSATTLAAPHTVQIDVMLDGQVAESAIVSQVQLGSFASAIETALGITISVSAPYVVVVQTLSPRPSPLPSLPWPALPPANPPLLPLVNGIGGEANDFNWVLILIIVGCAVGLLLLCVCATFALMIKHKARNAASSESARSSTPRGHIHRGPGRKVKPVETSSSPTASPSSSLSPSNSPTQRRSTTVTPTTSSSTSSSISSSTSLSTSSTSSRRTSARMPAPEGDEVPIGNAIGKETPWWLPPPRTPLSGVAFTREPQPPGEPPSAMADPARTAEQPPAAPAAQPPSYLIGADPPPLAAPQSHRAAPVHSDPSSAAVPAGPPPAMPPVGGAGTGALAPIGSAPTGAPKAAGLFPLPYRTAPALAPIETRELRDERLRVTRLPGPGLILQPMGDMGQGVRCAPIGRQRG